MPRKKFDPNRALFEIDADLTRELLGKPNHPDRHLRKMLADLSNREEQSVDLSTRSEVERLLGELVPDAPTGISSQLADFVTDGVVFGRIKLAVNRNDKALDVAINKAFVLAKLDPRDISDWYILLSRFCWAHFGEKGSPGAKVKWTHDQYRDLLRELHRTKLALGVTKDAPALKDMKGRLGRSYTRLKTSLREARSPEYNSALVQPLYRALTIELERDPENFPSREDAFRRSFCKAEADRIGASID